MLNLCFILLTGIEGFPLLVNAEHIIFARGNECQYGRTMISFNTKQHECIKESTKEIIEKVKKCQTKN